MKKITVKILKGTLVNIDIDKIFAFSDEARLRDFAQEIMDHWPEGGVDGDDLQEVAVKHGLLTSTIKYEPCRE